MDILILMIISSLSLEIIFLIIFIISLNKGQFDNTESQSIRIIFDDLLYNK